MAEELRHKLQPHQQRVVDRIQNPDQPGLVVAHGLGSGKSMTSIAAINQLSHPAVVVVPSSLRDNYIKEQIKHLGEQPAAVKIESMQTAGRRGYLPAAHTVVVDEAHRLRNSGAGQYAIRSGMEYAKKRLLLTASPFYNHPSEISPLVNMAAGYKALPNDAKDFNQRYISETKVMPGFLQALRGIRPGVEYDINPGKRKELADILHKWVDYHANSQENFPAVDRETVKVEMTPHQQEVYDTVMGQAPAWVSSKIKSGMPPSKSENSELNAFLTAARRVSNSTRGYDLSRAPEESKIDTAFARLKSRIDADPGHKAVVYSNYIDSGVTPYRERLQAAGIPYGEYTGDVEKRVRDQLVRDYNQGDTKVILMSSAGGEGLDLKETGSVQILDPHWNTEKLKQVEGRAIRYKSHEGLSPEKRRVLVENYISTRRPGVLNRIGVLKTPGSSDEYLQNMSKKKEDLNQKFIKLLASDRQQ